MGLGNSSRDWAMGGVTTAGNFLFFTVKSRQMDDSTSARHAIEIWKTDGSSAGTSFVKGFSALSRDELDITGMTAIAHRIAFVIRRKPESAGSYSELWGSDGSAIGTKQLLSAEGSVEVGFDEDNQPPQRQFILFTTNPGTSCALYETAGTPESTVKITEVAGRYSISGVGELGTTRFLAIREQPESDLNTLWRLDGAGQKTLSVVLDTQGIPITYPGVLIQSGELGIIPSYRRGAIWQVSLDQQTASLRGYVTRQGDQRNFGTWGRPLASHQGKFLFGLWGTTAGGSFTTTGLPNDLSYLGKFWASRPFYDYEGPATTTVGDNIFFLDVDFVSRDNPEFTTTFMATFYRSDLTPEGTVSLGTFGIGGGEQSNTSIGSVKNRYLFAGMDSTSWGLFSTEGTSADLLKMDVRVSTNQLIANMGDRALLNVKNRDTWETSMWITDGTPAGTREVDLPKWEFQDSIYWNGYLYLLASVPNEQGETRTGLWRTNGSRAGTALVKDLRSLDYARFASDASQLFFFAEGDNDELGLWRSDGTSEGTQVLRSWATNSSKYNFISATSAGVFTGVHMYSQSGRSGELWKTDGTAAGTALVKRWENGAGVDNSEAVIGNPVSLGSTIYFTAWNSAKALNELWKSDGTSAGTMLALNVPPDTFRKLQQELVSNGETVVFMADDGVVGMEPWAFTTKALEDKCPDDLRKMEPGLCGCGNTELDVDGDGKVDCGQRSGVPPTPRPTPTPTPTPTNPSGGQNDPSIAGTSVSAPKLTQEKNSVLVAMQEIPGASYSITYTVTLPKSALKGKKKVKPKTFTVSSATSKRTIGAFKAVGTQVAVTYKALKGKDETKVSSRAQITIKRTPKKKKKR
jgi:ELWxxDGT repeat protein